MFLRETTTNVVESHEMEAFFELLKKETDFRSPQFSRRSGTFVVKARDFFEDLESNNNRNFCKRNIVVIEFPRKVGCQCCLRIDYQYKQMKRVDQPYLKIKASCKNGPCRHQYIVRTKPQCDECIVHYDVDGIFLDKESLKTMHHTYASSPMKGKYRSDIFEDAFKHGSAACYANSLNLYNNTEVEGKNLTSLVSPLVIRKIVSERVKNKFVLSHVKAEVERLMSYENDPSNRFNGLIRTMLTEPFSVYMYSEDQLNIAITEFQHCSWNNPLQIVLDTSGEMLCPVRTSTGKKKLYNFALCLVCSKGNNVKIFFVYYRNFLPPFF